MKDKTWNRKRILKLIGRILLVLILLFAILVLLIRTPWAQNVIVSKITDYVSNKTRTKVAVKRVFITFSGDIQAEGIYLEDMQGDTLLYSDQLRLDLPIYPLLVKNELSIDDVYAQGLVAKIKRGIDPERFNFSFLIDAFAAPIDTTTTTEPLKISLGDFSLKEWKVLYEDNYLGTFIDLDLGFLQTDITEFDLESMTFGIGHFGLENTKISYQQTKVATMTNDTTAQTTLPKIKVGNFTLNEVLVHYDSEPDSIKTIMDLSQVSLSEILADVSKNSYQTKDFEIRDSNISIALNKTMDTTTVTQTKSENFVWPKLELGAGQIHLSSNTINFSRNKAQINDTLFNPNAFKISNLGLEASDFSYVPKKFRLDVQDFSFKESSGTRLQQLSFSAGLDDRSANISDLTIKLNNSFANADVKVKYESFEEALKSSEKSIVKIGLSNVKLEPADLQQLIPQLRKNIYLDSLAVHPVTGSLTAQGSLKKVDDLDTEIRWGSNTYLLAQGSLSNISQPQDFSYDLNNINIKSIRSDLNKFISDKNPSFQVPKTIALKGTLQGSLETFETKSHLTIPEGTVHLDATANIGKEKRFKGNLVTDSLQLGKLLKNERLGAISLYLNGSATGTQLSNLNAKVDGTLPLLQLNQYTYNDIVLSGQVTNGLGEIAMSVDDKNLNLKTNTQIDLNAETNSLQFMANIIGADLRELGFTKNDIKIAGDIQGTYNGNLNNYTIETKIENGIAVTDNEQYQITPIIMNAHVEDSITDATIQSGFLNGGVFSNASPGRINKALKKQLEGYFTSDSIMPSDLDDVKAKLDLALVPTPIISKVFFDGVEDLDSLNIDANFDARTKELTGKLIIPRFSYAGSSVDSLLVDLEGDATNLKFFAGVSDFEYQPVHLKKTFLEGNLRNKELELDFTSVNDTTQIMHVSSNLIFQKDTVSLRISPDHLILNKKQWNVPKDNKITLAESYSGFENLVLSRNSQKLQISTTVPAMETDHIGVIFENFQLQTFLSLFNPDEALAKGTVQGDFVILNPYGASGLISKLDINDFRLMKNPLGTLSLDASSKSLSDYDFDLVLKDGGADLRLTGDYVAKKEGADLNLELDIQKLETSILQGFLKDDISNASGNISGSLLVNGSLNEPSYSGILNFNNVGLTLSAFKTNITINDQKLDLTDREISFDNFKVNDTGQGTLTLNGKVITENLFVPKFDLSIKADKFTALDSKKGDNELVYGKAIVDTDLKVTGNLELPVINGTLSIGDATDLTYLVPQTQYEVQEREGVVIFVNRKNPDAIITRNSGETANSVFAGMDINTTLEISDDAIFTIVLDEKTQDKLQASGNATLSLNIDPNQDIRLSGRLELNSGFYRTSLYNLVSREFKINKGSSVVWSGDPYNAKLNVTAIYELETSAAPLMSSISFGQDTGISGQYQRSAPFLVYLKVGGEITVPELSFALDMPENAQGSYGGAVYGRIQQLNEQESELNKQVFSLLALNRFYPTTGSDGSNGGAVNLARNNVNKVLSSELNTISNKILGKSGFELDFDLDSFQDYQDNGYQNRTQLNINASKKLFDDRLIVTAGSAVDVEGSAASSSTETPVIGNVMLEYLLTEEGTYRLKGFRRQEYQNIIDGQLIVTGIAFIFDREFNKFSQLFSPVKVQTAADKTEAKKDENP